MPDIEALIAAVKDGQVVGNAAAAYAAIEALRKQADRYERDLIRSLRWEADGKPCGQVARNRGAGRRAARQPSGVLGSLEAAY